MKKVITILVCIGLCIVNLSFFPAAVHAAQTTATFNGLAFPDAQPVDKATSIDGFLFEGNTGLGMYYYATTGQDNSGCVVTNGANGSVQSLSIKRDNLSDFKLVSIYIDDSPQGGSSTYKIEGYLDGSFVDGCTIENIDAYTAHTEAINWGRIDEFKITATSNEFGVYDILAAFDNIVYDDPVDPNNTPTITTNTGLTLDEGATGSLQSKLVATDVESDDGTLAYTVTSSPANGQLENTDNPGVAISSFTQQNLTDGKIQYVHDDSNEPSDSFTFKVSDGTNELTGQTFSITVNPIDDDAPMIVGNNTLTLNEGATKTITAASHLLATDADSNITTLLYIITSGTSNGQVENTDNPGVAISSFTQQNLIDGKIQYVHDGSNTTSDSFTFKVSDGTNELTGQTFSIAITAVDDDAPTIALNNGLTLNEGATKSITAASDLSATDADTDDATLTYTVTSSPSNGQLENTDNPGVAITSFIHQNLVDGKIQYVHNGSNTTSDSFTFKVSDGTPNELTGQTFSITITAVDDDAPTIVRNNALTLDEGSFATITSGSHLSATDSEADDATLAYTVTASPSNGQLKNTDNLLVAITSFTQQDLVDGKIIYLHDDSNTTSDSFTFKVSDGTNELTGQTFSITITAVDDDTPTIVRNNGLTLNEGATKSIIEASDLSATDADSNDATLAYTITASLSNGQLENTDNPGVAITSFTQQNLVDGKIQYVHDGTNTTSDSFTFKVSDGTNELTGQTFSITITAVNDDAPTIMTNRGLPDYPYVDSTLLYEGGTKAITIDHLEADDSDTDNSTLVFTVTSSLSNGQLENTDNPGVAISSFTQQNLIDGKIQYVHDGTNTTSDSFGFKVSDGINELTGQTFNINITAVDDDAPTMVRNNTLTLDEGAWATITSGSHLLATDSEADDATLVYTVTSSLTNGQLKNTDNLLVAITSFTQQDLIDGKIIYLHDDSNTTSDSFTFKVSDGTNELTGQTFDITVNAVDDDAPAIMWNYGITLNEGCTYLIDSFSLSANDTDTSDDTLISYIVTSATSHGRLENTDNPGVAITSFTQQNLIDGKIQYVHDGSNTTSDSFGFKVSDGTNELTGQTFSITIYPIDDDSPTINKNDGLTLVIGATKTITSSSNLSATDADSDDATLAYTITADPTNGQLENSDNAGVAITSFTQQNLVDGKIQYVHDGSSTTSDSFTFKVSDGTNELTGQTFDITITENVTPTPTSTSTPTPTSTTTSTPTPVATSTPTPAATSTSTPAPTQVPSVNNHIITGTLLDSNGNPMAGYIIELHSTPKTVITDSAGKYTFYDVEYTDHTLIVKTSEGEGLATFSLHFTQGSEFASSTSQDDVYITYTDNTVSIKIAMSLGDDNSVTIDDISPIENPATGDEGAWLEWAVSIIIILISLGACINKKYNFVTERK